MEGLLLPGASVSMGSVDITFRVPLCPWLSWVQVVTENAKDRVAAQPGDCRLVFTPRES